MDLVAQLTQLFTDFGAAQTNGTHLTPQVQLRLNGQAFGTQTQSRIISVSLIDKRGFEADELTIELDDYDNAIAFPPANSTITLAIGFAQIGMIDKGEYILTECTAQGSPDTLQLTARAANIADTLAEQKDKSWHKTTLYQIVETIAKAHQYPYSIAQQYQNIPIAHIDQTQESDASFLTRLAEQHDAIATVKNGKLIFTPMGDSQSASGIEFPEVVITRASGDQHSFSYNAADAYQAVRARYTDKQTGKEKEVVVDKSNVQPESKKDGNGKQKGPKTNANRKIDTTGLKVKTLRHLYASNAAAWSGARAAYRKLARGVAQFSITLATGRPDLFPELPCTVRGFKPEIDNIQWIIVEVAHNFSQSGYTSSLKLEAKMQEGE
ncbi:contractile injection system protein, VgrG/Pvc8 family [Neisseriaceae bacterium B1]